jgi:hypothetical protein
MEYTVISKNNTQLLALTSLQINEFELVLTEFAPV